MSSSVMAGSLAAAIHADPAGLPQPDQPTAEIPTIPFSQTPVLVSARQMARADNVAADREPKGGQQTEDKSASNVAPSSEPMPAADLPRESGRKATPAPGEAQGLESLMQPAGWGTQVYSPPRRPGEAQLERPAASQRDEPSAGITRLMSQTIVGKRHGQPAEALVRGDGAAASAKTGSALVPEKNSAAVKGHALEMKQVVAKATGRPSEESNPQQMAEPAKTHTPRTERFVSSHPKKMNVENGKPLTEAMRNVQQGPRETNSPGRRSPVASVDSARVGQAAGATIPPTDGREVRLPPSGDPLMTQVQPGISGTDKSMIFSRPASDQTSTAGGFEGPAAKGSAQSIGEQIRDSLHASLNRGERQVVIRLHPPELGSVLVRFREQNEQIDGVLEVSRNDTRQEVEQVLPQVLRSLQDLGVQIRKFDVTVSEQSEKDPGRQQLHQDASPRQQPSDRQTNEDQRSNFEFRISDSEFPSTVSVPAGRLDMLA